MFCKHDWDVKVDYREPAPVERVTSMKTGSGSLPIWFFQSTRITILTCTKCGKVNKTIARSPV